MTGSKTGDRKDAHLALAASDLALSEVEAGFDRIRLEHCALPECDLDEIDITTSCLGRVVDAPLFIGAMTGGTAHADAINMALAEIAEEARMALAVGSQRASIESGRSQSALRQLAPSVPLISNLGGVQLAAPGGIDLAKRAVDDLRADAIFIHLNPLQEAVQPEGQTDWRYVLAALETAVRELGVPVMVKEVGAGIGPEFLDWGLPTVDAIRAVRTACPNGRLIASGGIRHGLDAAKALWLGAALVSMAGPVLRALTTDGVQTPDPQSALQAIDDFKAQLRLALFLTGAPDLGAFAGVPGFIGPR